MRREQWWSSRTGLSNKSGGTGGEDSNSAAFYPKFDEADYEDEMIEEESGSLASLPKFRDISYGDEDL